MYNVQVLLADGGHKICVALGDSVRMRYISKNMQDGKDVYLTIGRFMKFYDVIYCSRTSSYEVENSSSVSQYLGQLFNVCCLFFVCVD